MANTLTNLTHTILAQRILNAFTAMIAPIRAFGLNFSDEAVQRGDKVKVLQITAADAAKDWNGSYITQDADAEGLDITINKRKYVSWGLQTEDLATQPQLELDRFVEQKAFQLAKAFLQDVWSQVTNANYGAAAFTGAANTFDTDDIIDIRGVCQAADWPAGMRSLILDDTYVTNALKDASLKDASASGSTASLREGSMGRVAGFDIFESTLIPGNSENLVGFAAHPDAMLIATRTLIPSSKADDAGVDVEVISDEDSGLAMVSKSWHDTAHDTDIHTLEINYGYRVGNSAALKRLVSA